MQIGIDARYASGNMSGIARYTLNLLRGIALVNPDFRILVLTTEADSLPGDVRRSAAFDLVPLRRSPRGAWEQCLAPRTLRRLGIRLLHSLDAFSPLGARCLKVITIYDLIPITCREVLHSSVKARWWRLWAYWLELQSRAASRVITLSRHSALDIERLLNVPEGKIRIIPSGVQLPAETAAGLQTEARGIVQGGPFLLYVGRRDPYKNLAGLVRAFARVRADLKDCRLIIAGAPDARYREPEMEARRLGLEHAVIFTGHIGDAAISELYRHAAVFVFPSLYEGFGLPPLEAMARGAPVVASNRTSVPEAVGDAALLVDPTDPSEMAAAISRILSDPLLGATLREAGLKRAASFTLRKQAEQTLRVYEELIERA